MRDNAKRCGVCTCYTGQALNTSSSAVHFDAVKNLRFLVYLLTVPALKMDEG